MVGFECRTPLVVLPLFEPAGHRPLQAVDLGFQNGVPGDLPLPPQPVLQAYFILNAGLSLSAHPSTHKPDNGSLKIALSRSLYLCLAGKTAL